MDNLSVKITTATLRHQTINKRNVIKSIRLMAMEERLRHGVIWCTAVSSGPIFWELGTRGC
eukprot:scaffold110472_cov36-Cyclotella_meneghiniana.AAC.1